MRHLECCHKLNDMKLLTCSIKRFLRNDTAQGNAVEAVEGIAVVEVIIVTSHTIGTIGTEETNRIDPKSRKPIRPLEAVVIGDADEPEVAVDVDEADQIISSLANNNQKMMLSR